MKRRETITNRDEDRDEGGYDPRLVEYALIIIVIVTIAWIAVFTILGGGPGETMRQIVEALGLSP